MGLLKMSGGSPKPFPRQGAFCVIGTTREVGVIHQYPQQNGGGEEAPGKPIITFDPDAAEVHVLNEDGSTKAEYRNVPVRDLRIATLKEIPRPRRMNAVLAAKYGYA